MINDAWLSRLLGLAKRVSGIMVWGPPTRDGRYQFFLNRYDTDTIPTSFSGIDPISIPIPVSLNRLAQFYCDSISLQK